MCWETLWPTRCRSLTSSCSLTANSSMATSTCPSPSMAPRLHPPPRRPPPPHPRRNSATCPTTTAPTAWSRPAIRPLTPPTKLRFRAPRPCRSRWVGGRGWAWQGRSEVRRSCAWCAETRLPAITTTLSLARDAKVFSAFFLMFFFFKSSKSVSATRPACFDVRLLPSASRFLQAECNQESRVSVQEWRWLWDGHVHEEEVPGLQAEEVSRSGDVGRVYVTFDCFLFSS